MKRLLLTAALASMPLPLHAEPFCRAVKHSTEPASHDSGMVEIVENGSDSTDNLDRIIKAAFRKAHPEIQIIGASAGTSATPALLEFGTVDIGLMGRQITANELVGYKKANGGAPLEIRLAHTPAAGAKEVAWSLAVYVSEKNPIQEITLQRLGQIVTSGSAGGDLKTWGQVDAAAMKDKMWRDAPIHIYSTAEYTGFGGSVQALFNRRTLASGTVTLGNSESILAHLQNDRYGIAIAALGVPPEGLRELPLHVDGGPAAFGTAEEIRNGTYPLARYAYLYAADTKDMKKRMEICTYLEFILSQPGQYAIESSHSGYVPLSPNEIASEIAKVD